MPGAGKSTVGIILAKNMNIIEIKFGSEEWEQARELRYDAFYKSLNLPKTVLDDDLDRKATHFAVKDKELVVAYGRLNKIERNDFQITQMVVSEHFQSKGLGKQLLNTLINKAKENKAAP